MIKTISHIMTDLCLDTDPDISIGRWGGEEFMILVPAKLEGGPEALAERIRKAFEKKVFDVSGSHTISLGVTSAIEGEHVDVWCQRADSALYEAKKTGKNRIIIK